MGKSELPPYARQNTFVNIAGTLIVGCFVGAFTYLINGFIGWPVGGTTAFWIGVVVAFMVNLYVTDIGLRVLREELRQRDRAAD